MEEQEEVWHRHSCPLCGAVNFVEGDKAPGIVCWSCKKPFPVDPTADTKYREDQFHAGWRAYPVTDK